jgi:hypothetical protein
MKKQIFQLTRSNGTSESVEYYPLVFLRGVDTWRLALHREPVLAGKGDWIVSDPVSGYRLCRVNATHKGMPVSSKHLTVTHARAAALMDLDTTVDCIGLDRFARVLNEAQQNQPVKG